jgi:hypothetical protein
MYSMPGNWTERQIQRMIGPNVGHPLATAQTHVAWENPQLRVEYNLVRHTATLKDRFAVRITPAVDPSYQTVVVPLAPDGQLHLVGRYRYPIGRWSIEFPRFDFDSSDAGWKDAAEADLLRATGLKAANMNLLGILEIDPALMSTSTVVILAQGCTAASGPQSNHRKRGKRPEQSAPAESDELIAGSVAVPIVELAELIERGEIVCGVTLAALSLYRVRLR